MKKLMQYNYYLYISLYVLIGVNILSKTKGNIKNTLIFVALFSIIILNNYLRYKFLYKHFKKYCMSIIVYIILSIIIDYHIGGYSDIFHFIILYELVLFTEGNLSKILIGVEIINVLFLDGIRYEGLRWIIDIEFWKSNGLEFMMAFMYVFFYLLSLFIVKALRKEKRKVDKLNKELELSYSQLMEQSEKIEELTISKERNRVAGEIHDTLGHSLVALNMNLDVAAKIIDSDINKTKELLKKSKILSKESMESLRKAVYALKEEKTTTLTEKLKAVAKNIQSTGEIEVILNIDERIETSPPNHKELIYTSIKESITNSIKHGKCDRINIDIGLNEKNIIINIKDNGGGCIDLVKGNGLLGIESRINSVGGSVIYNTHKEEGFEVEIII